MPFCFAWLFPFMFFGFFIYMFFFNKKGPSFQPPWNNHEKPYREKAPKKNYYEDTNKEIELQKKVQELEQDLEYLRRRLNESEN
ncbi:hypothetical protein [Halanaerobium hydrogeniformans]|uniref:Uncharacterized protein n=1 Tax=Halanaerobium hydrogeniformans TaxID=656519 RepID=E4RMX3_HALHG|nr:hypothetical protein [Halanaerobium hydrogeniformans]ADQ14190.1 hypothetical protein Halsa_0740 [Halanaerobium hydrogeniformans]